jgi:hypothetical protein
VAVRHCPCLGTLPRCQPSCAVTQTLPPPSYHPRARVYRCTVLCLWTNLMPHAHGRARRRHAIDSTTACGLARSRNACACLLCAWTWVSPIATTTSKQGVHKPSHRRSPPLPLHLFSLLPPSSHAHV